MSDKDDDSFATSFETLPVFCALPAPPMPRLLPVVVALAGDKGLNGAPDVVTAALLAADEATVERGLGGATSVPSARPSDWLTTALRSSALGILMSPL